MKIPIYQIDAFSSRVFSGNPAAVCPLEAWLDDESMQSIAAENNLSETAFFLPDRDHYSIRWFTPVSEVRLCGHATLASAFVVFNHIEPACRRLVFESASGPLPVLKKADMLSMDFPALPPSPCTCPPALAQGLGRQPETVLCSEDYLAVFKSQDDIVALNPDFEILKKLDMRAVIATAPGEEADFVSRFFAPDYGINEDPATGSAHCTLAPYWSRILGRKKLRAQQLSKRRGEIFCEDLGNRVLISGRAIEYMQGWISL
ncbi:MAG: isomerase [Candidatus Solincola sediminis]|uniref:Isomerase n=1 Tax=Candidatus Solincola sediminis TaxID=1797199 RepID=A0A1F2WLZ1_9ACTN|nr:MAG: isomerase [Candidatus Solincola sediminis]